MGYPKAVLCNLHVISTQVKITCSYQITVYFLLSYNELLWCMQCSMKVDIFKLTICGQVLAITAELEKPKCKLFCSLETLEWDTGKTFNLLKLPYAGYELVVDVWTPRVSFSDCLDTLEVER